MKPPAITPCPPPSESIRNGTSTSIAPNITDGTATNAAASRTGRLRIVERTSREVLAFRHARLGQPRRSVGEAERDHEDRAEDELGPDRGSGSAEHRTEERTGYRGAEGGADDRAAFAPPGPS